MWCVSTAQTDRTSNHFVGAYSSKALGLYYLGQMDLSLLRHC